MLKKSTDKTQTRRIKKKAVSPPDVEASVVYDLKLDKCKNRLKPTEVIPKEKVIKDSVKAKKSIKKETPIKKLK